MGYAGSGFSPRLDAASGGSSRRTERIRACRAERQRRNIAF